MNDSKQPSQPEAPFAPSSGSASETLDEWKLRHGINPNRATNQDELLMAAEESQAKGKSWCLGCDKHMPIREMKLITRSIDAYVQYGDEEGDYIKPGNRVRMCPACYKDAYESED